MKQQNVQDKFLNALRKEKIPVSVIITNGYQIKNATIVSFDNFCILIATDAGQNLLFKHAISSILPSKSVRLQLEAEGENEQ